MKELKKTIKFTSELEAINYLNTIKCYLVSSNNYKADKFKVYRGGGKKLLLSTSYRYPREKIIFHELNDRNYISNKTCNYR